MTDAAIGSTQTGRRLIVPPLGKAYASLGPAAETLMRVVAGLSLVTHGWGKIQNPFGAAGMGVFWSPLLAATEFFGGILIAIGLLTRPAAFAATIVLVVTVYFHWVVQGDGFGGADNSIIWAAVMLFFAIRGGNRHSVDARLGREF